MRNAVILGSGRSGTSMVSGMFAGAGYLLGPDVMPPNRGNPKGIFESRAINLVNEELMRELVPVRPESGLGRVIHRGRLASSQLWLAIPPVGATLPELNEALQSRIAAWTSRSPFAFKDPRFAYTLQAWRPWMSDAVMVCVFREPARTAESIVRECREERYLRNVRMSFDRAVSIWKASYEWILRVQSPVGRWLFVHFEQIMDGSGIDRLEDAIGASLDRSFPEPQLSRSRRDGGSVPGTQAIYEELCERAGYSR